MNPHETALIQKLDQEIKNLSILMQGTEVGDSLTLKEVRHLLYELNKSYEATICEQPVQDIPANTSPITYVAVPFDEPKVINTFTTQQLESEFIHDIPSPWCKDFNPPYRP